MVNGLVSLSVTDAQGLIIFSHEADLRQPKAGKIWWKLELPYLPVKPGKYIVACTISDDQRPVAFLRATPELTVLADPRSAAGWPNSKTFDQAAPGWTPRGRCQREQELSCAELLFNSL